MAFKILNPTHRFSWPFILSVGLHSSLVAGLLYASVTQLSAPAAVQQPMTVTLVAPEQAAVKPQPPVETPKVEPETQKEPEKEPELEPIPEPEPEPPAPVQKPKPAPKPKPTPKAVVKPHPKVSEPKMEPTPVADPPHDAPTRPAPPAAAATPLAATEGPKLLDRPNPGYPERARALGIEGMVKIMYDVDDSGQVVNVRIISATPRNMFEREIRQITRRWRYAPGRPGKDLNLTIQFELTGISAH